MEKIHADRDQLVLELEESRHKLTTAHQVTNYTDKNIELKIWFWKILENPIFVHC